MTKVNATSIILDKFNVSKSDFLGSGMEAEVYAYDNNKVLKLYNDMSDTNKQNILKGFYSKINASSLSYELPYIYDTFEENGILVTIEKRIEGSNMQGMLSEMNFNEQNTMMETYLNANLELKSVKVKSNLEGFTLFNDNQISLLKIKSWFELLKEIIFRKQNELESYFKKDVVNYDAKVNQLVDILSLGYEGEYSLIHGDFYPGNLMVNKNGMVTGLIDFGLMTMYGDNLFDIAIGWVCFDMYNELNANIYERYLNIIISTLGEGVRKRLYFYVLIYSFISANFYSHNCEDGHYQWCVKNLNNKHFWEAL
ncbi:aminoglycoside phosphotransferase family protein [Neobacillus sp. PS2-9]|uniref:aminoglycoside phosphotransferase family protein n=1 Tax=Neobacillus sp. PS2-9 TaxID=3070676 RepID=UPI0027E1C1E6|nr:aminoglycoside phosphotransferase family protein [Neobacillus sp. PS2-9]WML57184.1 aminoglycoside phosphotransferase family protein [Neobacillus sp. PS2-9]